MIEKMKLLSVRCSRDQYLELASHAVAKKNFHPILANDVIKSKMIGFQYAQDQVYTQLKTRIDAVDKGLNLGLVENLSDINEVELDVIKDTIDKVEGKYEKFTASRARTSDKEDKEALAKLHEYLHGQELQYIAVHLGRIPLEALSRVTLYNNEAFIFTELVRNKHYVWIMYLCMKEDDKHFEEMFGSLYFETVDIPKDMEQEEEIRDYCKQALGEICGFVAWRSKMEQFEKFVSVEEDTILFNAFVPEDEVEEFKKEFSDFEIEDVENSDYHFTPPTKLSNRKSVKPFESFVEMYGLPRYGTFDPTTFFAITYSLLFGIMFGDLGQGVVISLVGWFMLKKKGMGLGAVLMRIGMFSAFFGIIYGSVFGDETILDGFLRPFGLPIHVGDNDMTQPLLIAAVAMGVILIVISMLMNVLILMKQKRYASAILSQNGVCGIVFYVYLVVGAVLNLVYKVNIFTTPLLILCVGLPLLSIMFHVPIHNAIQRKKLKPEDGWGGYITESFFELFEVLLSFMANTLSFLRVGGFILSHVGMMTVVMELRVLAGTAGPLVLIFGNILVIGLEGLIVGIQALRLEYYEMFSRYYESGGVEYKTL
ncbi:hypothetical protein AOC36_11580 [Erysipelothrix larvae]|uniref:Uncharacterized protein n=1 Tax=Erysipelothrix larvae TaxID=1514105 RepID=A0A120JU15_9FIRM|nr:V-type ATPase 116kDa subunit family protein [Erysipelothrix larvae]AMC94590.1 hypothetical protein AOC36_11580 [Erysipelothrix larvae]